ncbi:hypothetical protein ONZ45_g18765 [Pleurotus djamor]|nr:hypothetical protein ONZ45_g18765 [Pleurotus djamor]
METSWRDLKLSLERPYKNDNGEPILNLLDITQQGEFIYETKDPPSKALGEKLGRIFIERGFDFFDKIQENPNSYLGELPQPRDEPSEAQNQDTEDEEEEPSSKFMSAEELAKMRMELAQELV